nr:ATP-citrate synthase beta chain protein 2 [Tanacetum cinerariifolium]
MATGQIFSGTTQSLFYNYKVNNFASFRSAAASSKLALKQPTIKVVAIIAKGVPESDTKELISYAKSNNKAHSNTFFCLTKHYYDRYGHSRMPDDQIQQLVEETLASVGLKGLALIQGCIIWCQDGEKTLKD